MVARVQGKGVERHPHAVGGAAVPGVMPCAEMGSDLLARQVVQAAGVGRAEGPHGLALIDQFGHHGARIEATGEKGLLLSRAQPTLHGPREGAVQRGNGLVLRHGTGRHRRQVEVALLACLATGLDQKGMAGAQHLDAGQRGPVGQRLPQKKRLGQALLVDPLGLALQGA